MHYKTILSLLIITILAGCATQQPTPARKVNDAIGQPAVQFTAAGAKITRVDAKFKFVVVDFSARAMPAIGTRLAVYRNGQWIGEVQLIEPVRVSFATADILHGDVRVGDEVR